MANELQGPEPKMDATNLYREEIITDRRVGTIRLLTPISPSGAVDSKRKVLYVGETQVLTAGGMLPISLRLAPSSLRQGHVKFSPGVERAVGWMHHDIQQRPRALASSIVIADRQSARRLLLR